MKGAIDNLKDGVVGSLSDKQRKVTETKDLFKKFNQIDRPVGGRGYKGTGLGLAICKEIVEQHQGKIWAESKLGQGAAFHFTVPIVTNP